MGNVPVSVVLQLIYVVVGIVGNAGAVYFAQRLLLADTRRHAEEKKRADDFKQLWRTVTRHGEHLVRAGILPPSGD